MSLQHLKEDYLYSLLPEGVLNLDQRGILRAVCGGYQDRVEDLRSYASKFELLFDPLHEFPETGNDNVLLVTYRQPDQGNVIPCTILLDETTPAISDYQTEDAWLEATKAWAAEKLGIEVEKIVAVEITSDPLKSVDANTLQYLAATVGAVLYKTSTLDPELAKKEEQRALVAYFPRLKVKGTSRSFDVLGRLLNFGDVKMTPLWSRVNIRLPNDVGNPVNDEDFSSIPDYEPSQFFGPTYNPLDLTDGPFFSWESPSLSTNRSAENFYPQAVNGYNPFVKIVVDNSGSVQHPGFPAVTYPQTFTLGGGGPHTKASVVAVASGFQSAKMQFIALAEGDSFNGLQIVAPSAGSLRIQDARLSSIKYRSSFYNLSLTIEPEKFSASYGDIGVQKNKDLSPGDGGNPSLCPDGTAVSPYRPWSGGTAGSISRAQANPATGQRQLDLVKLNAVGVQASQYLDEVRAATRFPRKVLFGFMVNDSAIYAAFPSRTVLFTTNGIILSGSGVASGFPLSPYNVIIVLEIPGPSGYTTVATVGEQDPLVSTKVNYLTSNFSGWYDYATAAFSFTFNTAAAGTRVVARWTPTSTDLIRPEPSLILKSSGTDVGYLARAEDEQISGSAVFGQVDEYPWRRETAGGQALVDLDLYQPTTPDFSLVELEKTMVVEDQTGAEFSLDGFDLASSTSPSPIRILLTPRSSLPASYRPGQQAMALRSNRLCKVGSANGVLVADLLQFYGPAHTESLVGWFPFNQHPEDQKVVLDHSKVKSTTLLTSVLSTDRVWDAQRGWVLNLRNTCSIAADQTRGLLNDSTISFWIKPGVASGAGSSTIFELGSTRVLSGSIQPLKSYRVVGAGTVTYNGTVYSQGDPSPAKRGFVGVAGIAVFVTSGAADVIRSTVETDAFNDIAVISADLTNTGTPTLTWYGKNASTTTPGSRVAIGSIALSAGVFNQVYLRRTGNSFAWAVNTLGGTVAELTATTAVLGFGNEDSFLKVSGGQRSFAVHDLRIWNKQKTETELKTKIRAYSFKTSVLSGRPPFLTTLSRGEKWALQVLDTGWVVPQAQVDVEMPVSRKLIGTGGNVYGVLAHTPVKPGTVIVSHGTTLVTDNGTGGFAPLNSVLSGSVSYSTGSIYVQVAGTSKLTVGYSWLSQDFNHDKLARVSRYDATGRFHGDSKFEELGVGGGQALPTTFKLGTQFTEVTSFGTVVVSTQHSALPGVSVSWGSTSPGSYLRVTPPYTSDGGSVKVILSGTVSPWPNLTPAENPGRSRCWVEGDNKLVYEVTVEDVGAGPSLHADLIARRRSVGELLILSTGSLNEDQRDNLAVQENLSGAHSKLATTTQEISVREVIGSPYSASRLGIDTTITPANPTAPSFKGKVRLRFSTSELIAVAERVALVVSSSVAGLEAGTYWGTVTRGTSQTMTGYDVEIKVSGLTVGQYNPVNRADSTSTTTWQLFRGLQQVYSKAQTGLLRPPTYLYLDKHVVFSAQGTQVYNNWDDPTPLATDQSFATRASAGLISFTNSGSLTAGPHRLTIDAGNIGRVDPGFDGFDVEISLGNSTALTKLVEEGQGNNPRGLSALEVDLQATPDPWTLAIDWTNDRDIPEQGYQRQLAIFGFKLEKLETKLYRVDVQPFQLVDAGTVSGGLLWTINSYGTLSSVRHESQVKPDLTVIDGPTGYTSRVPLSGLLTSTTIRRREDVILKSAGSLGVVLSDSGSFAAPSISGVVLTPP